MKNPNFCENHMAYVERVTHLPCRHLLLQRNATNAQVCSRALQLINDACGVSGGVTRSWAVRRYRKRLRNKNLSRNSQVEKQLPKERTRKPRATDRGKDHNDCHRDRDKERKERDKHCAKERKKGSRSRSPPWKAAKPTAPAQAPMQARRSRGDTPASRAPIQPRKPRRSHGAVEVLEEGTPDAVIFKRNHGPNRVLPMRPLVPARAPQRLRSAPAAGGVPTPIPKSTSAPRENTNQEEVHYRPKRSKDEQDDSDSDAWHDWQQLLRLKPPTWLLKAEEAEHEAAKISVAKSGVVPKVMPKVMPKAMPVDAQMAGSRGADECVSGIHTSGERGTSRTPPVETKGERRRSAAPRSRSRDAPEHRRSSTATRGRPSALRAALGPPRAASQLGTGGASQRDASRGSRPVSAGGAQRRLMEVEPQRHASTEVPEPAECPDDALFAECLKCPVASSPTNLLR